MRSSSAHAPAPISRTLPPHPPPRHLLAPRPPRIRLPPLYGSVARARARAAVRGGCHAVRDPRPSVVLRPSAVARARGRAPVRGGIGAMRVPRSRSNLKVEQNTALDRDKLRERSGRTREEAKHHLAHLNKVLTTVKTHEQLATGVTSRTLETTNRVVGDSDHRWRDRWHPWAVRASRWCRSASRGENTEVGMRVPHCDCRQLQAASHNLTSVDWPKVRMPFVAMIIFWPWY